MRSRHLKFYSNTRVCFLLFMNYRSIYSHVYIILLEWTRTRITYSIFLGRPPDFLAFIICLLMMILLAAGVKKSLIFNNILNAINLAVWVFVMAAGMFYIDSSNWTQHGGFLPKGWSGVSVKIIFIWIFYQPKTIFLLNFIFNRFIIT